MVAFRADILAGMLCLFVTGAASAFNSITRVESSLVRRTGRPPLASASSSNPSSSSSLPQLLATEGPFELFPLAFPEIRPLAVSGVKGSFGLSIDRLSSNELTTEQDMFLGPALLEMRYDLQAMSPDDKAPNMFVTSSLGTKIWLATKRPHSPSDVRKALCPSADSPFHRNNSPRGSLNRTVSDSSASSGSSLGSSPSGGISHSGSESRSSSSNSIATDYNPPTDRSGICAPLVLRPSSLLPVPVAISALDAIYKLWRQDTQREQMMFSIMLEARKSRWQRYSRWTRLARIGIAQGQSKNVDLADDDGLERLANLAGEKAGERTKTW